MFTISDGQVIFESKNSDLTFAFVYEKDKINLIGFSIIFIFASLIEIFLAIKIFKFRFGKLYGVCAPVWLLIYIQNFDLFLFIISLWILIFSTLILIYSIKENKKRNEFKNKLNNMYSDEITKEDEELYDFIIKSKKQEEFELEEIK